MYTIDNAEICAALDADSRCFRTILDFGSFFISGDDVGRISINGGSVQEELPCIGDVVSAQAEILVMNIPDGITMEGLEFRVYIYCISPTGISLRGTTHAQLADVSHEFLSRFTHAQIAELGIGGLPFLPIPLGKFTVLKCRKGSDYYTLTCSDRLHFADKKYVPRISFPNNSNAVVADICNQLGADTDMSEYSAAYLKDCDDRYILTSDGKRLLLSTWQFDIPSAPQGTMREVLSYIAAMRGKFVVIDRSGTIVQRWYLADGQRELVLGMNSDGNTDGTNCRISEFDFGETNISVSYLVCHVDDNTTYTSGYSGNRTMEFDCPFMTQARLNKLRRDVSIPSYTPCEMTQQLGDPRLDVWDGWKYNGDSAYTTLLMLNIQMICDGGLMIEISSGGDTDTESYAGGRY